MTTRATTIMAATMATMATVDTWPYCLSVPAAKLRGERNYPRPRKRLRESREHRQVGVKRDRLRAAHAERRKPVVVRQSLS